VDESEIDSANETAALGWPFRFPWTHAARSGDRGKVESVSFGLVPRDRPLVWIAVVVGLALIVLAVVYWAEPAKSLPSWIPGHEAGSNHHHVKHGIASFLLGCACLVFAWFRSAGPRPRRAAV
jgi:hypothetical protein